MYIYILSFFDDGDDDDEEEEEYIRCKKEERLSLATSIVGEKISLIQIIPEHNG